MVATCEKIGLDRSRERSGLSSWVSLSLQTNQIGSPGFMRAWLLELSFLERSSSIVDFRESRACGTATSRLLESATKTRNFWQRINRCRCRFNSRKRRFAKPRRLQSLPGPYRIRRRKDGGRSCYRTRSEPVVANGDDRQGRDVGRQGECTPSSPRKASSDESSARADLPLLFS